MFAKLTQVEDTGTQRESLVFFGEGGVIKAVRFSEDNTTELYNQEGNMVAKVTEDLNAIQLQVR
jgi:hypothetical protein